jgi:hypothetical protein
MEALQTTMTTARQVVRPLTTQPLITRLQDALASSSVSQFNFFYKEISGLLKSFREKLTNDDGDVSVTAVVCATFSAFSLSVVVSLGSSAYVHIRVNNEIKQACLANQSALNLVDLNNKSAIDSLIASMRGTSMIKEEPKCSIENELV